MKTDDLNYSEDKLDIFKFYYILLKNIKILILSLLISIILGIIFYYNLPPKFFSKDRNGATINVLVDESPLLSSIKIVEALNTTLASAFNYEKWCSEINKNCDNPWLGQEYAAHIQVLPREHWAILKFSTMEHLAEITSFISFTIQRVNSKILKDTDSMYQSKINKLEDQIEVQNLELRKIEKEAIDSQIKKQAMALDDIKDSIQTRTDSMQLAEDELSNLESLLETSESGNKLILSLKIIDVINSIKRDKLQINNLKKNLEKKQSSYSGEDAENTIVALPSLEEFETVYTSDEQNIELFLRMYPNVEMRIIQLKQSIYRLEENLNTMLIEEKSESKKVLALGRINSSFQKVSKYDQIIPIITVFIFAGFVLCSIFILLKEEYIKRQIK